jgi:hypothetical protein
MDGFQVIPHNRFDMNRAELTDSDSHFLAWSQRGGWEGLEAFLLLFVVVATPGRVSAFVQYLLRAPTDGFHR